HAQACGDLATDQLIEQRVRRGRRGGYNRWGGFSDDRPLFGSSRLLVPSTLGGGLRRAWLRGGGLRDALCGGGCLDASRVGRPSPAFRPLRAPLDLGRNGRSLLEQLRPVEIDL